MVREAAAFKDFCFGIDFEPHFLSMNSLLVAEPTEKATVLPTTNEKENKPNKVFIMI